MTQELESTSDAGLVRDLRLIIVGAQKGGSTSLARALARHPALFLPRDEIPLFEGELFTRASLVQAARRLAPGAGRVLGLKRPDLLLDPLAPSRIASTVRDPLIVAVLRDPVERAVSAYWWYVQLGLLPLDEIEVGMRRLLAARSGGIALSPREEQVLSYGFYSKGLQRYLTAIGPENVVVLLANDLQDGSGTRAVTSALGLDDQLLPVRSENSGTYDMTRLRFLRLRAPLLADSQRRDYYEQGRRLRYRVGRVAARVLNEVDRRLLVHAVARPAAGLQPDTLAELRSLYRADSDALQGALGRPAPWVALWDELDGA